MITHLFLDFDGVLHPLAGPPFSRLPFFELVLREFPHVKLVISSSWRTDLPLSTILEYFSPDIAARVIGSTPDLGDFITLTRYARHDEIQTYLSGTEIINWLAIDDARWQFPTSAQDRLICCDPAVGFDESIAANLRFRLTNG